MAPSFDLKNKATCAVLLPGIEVALVHFQLRHTRCGLQGTEKAGVNLFPNMLPYNDVTRSVTSRTCLDRGGAA